MIIELIPNRNTYNVKLKVSDDGFTTETTMSSELTIGSSMRCAIENHYKEVARIKIQQTLGGMSGR